MNKNKREAEANNQTLCGLAFATLHRLIRGENIPCFVNSRLCKLSCISAAFQSLDTVPKDWNDAMEKPRQPATTVHNIFIELHVNIQTISIMVKARDVCT